MTAILHQIAHAMTPDARADRLEHIIASISEGIVSIDAQQRITLVNEATERMFGHTAAQMIGRPLGMLMPERLRGRHHEHLRKFDESGQTGRPMGRYGEIYGLRANGEEFLLEASVSQSGTSPHKVFTVIVRDISERQQVEEARAQLAAIVETSDDAIVSYHPDGTVLSWNAAAQKILGYTVAEMIGRNISTLAPPERMYESQHSAWLLQHGKPVPPFESVRLSKDGRLVDVQVSTSAVRNVAGHVVRIAVILRDVTERKEADAARAWLAAIVENSNDAIFSRKLDGTILTWNAGAEHMLGYSAAEAIGKPATYTLPPGRQLNIAANNEKVLSGRSTVPHDSKRLTKDGRLIDVLTSHSPIKDSAGNIVGASVILQDIAARLEAEKQLRLSAAVFEATEEGIIVTDASNHIILVNPAFTCITGYTPGEVIGKPPSLLSSELQDEAFYETMWASINDTGRWQGEIRDRRKNGEIYCESLSISTVKNARGEILYHTAIFSDISERKQAEETQARLAAIVEGSNDAIISRSLDRKILSWNAAAQRLFGYPMADAIGQDISLIIPSERKQEAVRNRGLLAQGIAVLDLETERLAKDGQRVAVSMSQSPIKDEHGAVVGVSLIFRDIRERKQAAERIDYLAQYDAVTGLPNRRLFNDRLVLAIARDKRLGMMTAVLLLDLDRFKQINESLGHSVGDKVLQAVTARLSSLLREVDTIARFGGDEFVVILESVTETAQAVRVAEKIVEAMAEALVIEGEEIYVTASVGVALYPADADSTEKLVENAELAMYEAKRAGRNTLQLYAPEQNTRRAGAVGMESKLRRALEHDEFELHFQPKVDMRSGAITGAEALIRWRNAELGLVSPADFIPLAEETGLIVPIGEWVLHRACAQASAWHRLGYPLTVAVNLSARQFRQKNLCDMVQQTLADSSLDAAHLELEITESMVMHHPEEAIATLQELHDIGLKLSVDDFGTGYSSLSYLKRFPVDILKVDRSFVRDLHQDPDDAAIVRAVIALARSLNLKTVAEGVETEQQLMFLAGLDCDEYQGYYFSKPLLEADFLSLVRAKCAAA